MRGLDRLIHYISEHPWLAIAIFFLAIPILRKIKNWSIVARAKSQGGFYVDDLHISVLEFYETLIKKIESRNLVEIKCTQVSLRKSPMTPGSRKYLKIQKGELIFYVCSFSVGDAQVFTHWQITPLAIGRRIISAVPLFGGMLKAMFFPDTLYSIDVMSTLNGMITEDINTVSQSYTKGEQVLRPLDSLDHAALMNYIS